MNHHCDTNVHCKCQQEYGCRARFVSKCHPRDTDRTIRLHAKVGDQSLSDNIASDGEGNEKSRSDDTLDELAVTVEPTEDVESSCVSHVKSNESDLEGCSTRQSTTEGKLECDRGKETGSLCNIPAHCRDKSSQKSCLDSKDHTQPEQLLLDTLGDDPLP